MAKGSLIEQLDEAVEAIMANSEAPAVSPRVAAILRIAGELRDLPRKDFKERLKRELLPAQAVGGKPLITEQDIYERIAEMANEPKLVPYDIGAALSDLPEMSMRFLTSLNNLTLIVSRGSSPSHWERHPGGNELIYMFEGAGEIITLTDDGPVRSTLREGSIFICPKGLWHRSIPKPSIAALYLTPGEGTEASTEDDPRPATQRRKPARRGTKDGATATPKLESHDLRAALNSVRELIITENTTGEDADAAVANVARLDNLTLGVMRYQGQTPWERHMGADEFLFAIDGEVDITVMTEDGPVERRLRAGNAFVCLQGLWHRQFSRESVAMLYGTAIETSEHSFADDPRKQD
jgi:quercetin dioxygenase-like cupin family protein